MANATFAAEGYADMLLALIEGQTWFAHVYTNDPTIDAALTTAMMVEPVYAGYAPQPLRWWSPPAIRGATAFSVHDIVVFEWVSGPAPLPIRGYYVTNGLAGSMAWARRRPGAAYPLGPGSPQMLLYLRLDFPPG